MTNTSPTGCIQCAYSSSIRTDSPRSSPKIFDGRGRMSYGLWTLVGVQQRLGRGRQDCGGLDGRRDDDIDLRAEMRAQSTLDVVVRALGALGATADLVGLRGGDGGSRGARLGWQGTVAHGKWTRCSGLEGGEDGHTVDRVPLHECWEVRNTCLRWCLTTQLAVILLRRTTMAPHGYVCTTGPLASYTPHHRRPERFYPA